MKRLITLVLFISLLLILGFVILFIFWKKTENVAPKFFRLDDNPNYYSIKCASYCSLVYNAPGKRSTAGYIAIAPEDPTVYQNKPIEFKAKWKNELSSPLCIKNPCDSTLKVSVIEITEITTK